jgi:hypothetical protein
MDELSLTGTQGQDNFTYIYLTFSECVNNTSDGKFKLFFKPTVQSVSPRNKSKHN